MQEIREGYIFGSKYKKGNHELALNKREMSLCVEALLHYI